MTIHGIYINILIPGVSQKEAPLFELIFWKVYLLNLYKIQLIRREKVNLNFVLSYILNLNGLLEKFWSKHFIFIFRKSSIMAKIYLNRFSGWTDKRRGLALVLWCCWTEEMSYSWYMVANRWLMIIIYSKIFLFLKYLSCIYVSFMI